MFSQENRKFCGNPWTRRLWWTSAAGLLIAVIPFAIGGVGLATGSMYLQTYHWLAYFSVPVGLPIALIGGIAAVIMTIRDLSKGKAEKEKNE